MFCTSCAASLPPGAPTCLNCGAVVAFPDGGSYSAPAPLSAPFAGPAINNYLVPSILVTLCCCMPFGIVAIVFAAQVNSKLAAGDVAGAQSAANTAKMWCWIGLASGLVFAICYGFFTGFAIINQR
jgi:hypothetical protein